MVANNLHKETIDKKNDIPFFISNENNLMLQKDYMQKRKVTYFICSVFDGRIDKHV